MEKFAYQKLERETKNRNNLLSCSEFINLLTTEEIPDSELVDIFNAFDCDGKALNPRSRTPY